MVTGIRARSLFLKARAQKYTLLYEQHTASIRTLWWRACHIYCTREYHVCASVCFWVQVPVKSFAIPNISQIKTYTIDYIPSYMNTLHTWEWQKKIEKYLVRNVLHQVGTRIYTTTSKASIRVERTSLYMRNIKWSHFIYFADTNFKLYERWF